jgi:L-cysteine S-thiosulfotransferase
MKYSAQVMLLSGIGAVFAWGAFAQVASEVAAPNMRPSSEAINAAVAKAFAKAPADWQSRLTGDDTMKVCSASGNNIDGATSKIIDTRERATIEYPSDGIVLGDWKQGERIAQSGYGLRFTDYPAAQPNGGNCYACHQMTKAEVSYGTIGPSLLEYGKIRKFTAEENKATYEKIYNSHVSLPCSLMPRFGTNKILTVEQIKDVTALLMSPDSPVNK